jgi:hypothetical protein
MFHGITLHVTSFYGHAGINSDERLQLELAVFNSGLDFDGLEHFTYNNSGFVNLLFDHLSDTNFDGITVCILIHIIL